MMAAVHALIGAALGRVAKNHGQAIAAGVLSHMAADALPHRDLEMPQEAALLAAALGVVALARGPRSREFVGALAGVAPDIENVIVRIAGLDEDKMLLPTHRGAHGRETDSLLPQAALALACLAVLAVPDRGRDKDG